MKQKKLFTSVLVGNTMEFYDFMVFAFMSKHISALFFPNADILISYISTFTVFASGYLMRPIGGLFFGYIGDKYGRKISLSYSILIITVSTFLIGLLPTYNYVGIIAPILLMFCRLLQGFSVSGEQSGAAVYLSEVAGSNKLVYAGSMVLGSAYFGVLLGSATCLILNLTFTEQQIVDFAWRLPFFLSLLLGIPSLIMRHNLIETQMISPSKMTNPISELFRISKKDVLLDILMVSSLSIPIYLFTVFMPSYLTVSLKVDITTAQIISVISLLFLSLGVPLLGRISDKHGISKIYFIGCIYNIVFSYPIFLLITTGNYFLIVLGVFLLGLGLLFLASTMFAILILKYSSNVRYTAISFIFNTSMSIFGSTAPAVAFYLISQTKNLLTPWMLVLFSGIMGIATYTLNIQAKSLNQRKENYAKDISFANTSSSS